MNFGQIFPGKTAASDAKIFISQLGKNTPFHANNKLDGEFALVQSRQFMVGLIALAQVVGHHNPSARWAGESSIKTGLRLIAGGQIDIRAREAAAVLALGFEVAIQTPEMFDELDMGDVLSTQDTLYDYSDISFYAATWLAQRWEE